MPEPRTITVTLTNDGQTHAFTPWELFAEVTMEEAGYPAADHPFVTALQATGAAVAGVEFDHDYTTATVSVYHPTQDDKYKLTTFRICCTQPMQEWLRDWRQENLGEYDPAYCEEQDLRTCQFQVYRNQLFGPDK